MVYWATYFSGCNFIVIIMKISEQITTDFFSLEKMQEHGFWMIPERNDTPLMCIMADDLQKYFKKINDKIKELESNNNT